MDNQKIGIAETLDMVDFATTFGNAVDSSLEDGKISILDITKFFTVFGKVGQAIDGATKIPSELNDLTSEESDLIKQRFQKSLQLHDHEIEEVVYSGFTFAIAGAEFLSKLNAVRAARKSA
jgi:hypothetical protein